MSGDTPRSFTLTDGFTIFGSHDCGRGVNQASKHCNTQLSSFFKASFIVKRCENSKHIKIRENTSLLFSIAISREKLRNFKTAETYFLDQSTFARYARGMMHWPTTFTFLAGRSATGYVFAATETRLLGKLLAKKCHYSRKCITIDQFVPKKFICFFSSIPPLSS